jgi:hypothetical protein
MHHLQAYMLVAESSVRTAYVRTEMAQKYLSSGVHVSSNHRISPRVTAVAKLILSLGKLYMSVIRSDVTYSEPFPDAQDHTSGNGLHTSRHWKCGSVPGMLLITARCDDTQVSVTNVLLLKTEKV